MKTVLVAGEINVDLVFGGCSGMPKVDTEVLAEAFRQVPGSSSMICAMGLARLHQPVLFAGVAGADAYGDFCLDAMRDAGIDMAAVQRRRDVATGVTVSISTQSDRALVTHPGCIAALQAADVDDALLARADHLHVSSMYLQQWLHPQLASLFKRARAAGLSTSLDPGFDPQQKWGDASEWQALLAQVDVFLPSRREVCAIAGREDLESATAALANGHTQIVAKCSSDGAVARGRNGSLLRVSTHRPNAIVDSTGAGDSFNAGFLHAWLQGSPLRECLHWGNACGSLSTRAIGGTAGQANQAEAQAWLEQQA